MTDSQAINSSVLAEYLDVLKQMQNSLLHFANLPAESTAERIAYRIFDRIKTHQILDDLDALRALVAEQEQEESDAQRVRIPEGATIGEIGELVNAHAVKQMSTITQPIYSIEQEQASAGEPDEIDLAVKAAFERRMHAHSINVPCEEKDCALCKKRAAEQLGTSPRFAVGDTVRVKHGYSFHRFGGIVGLEGVVKETGITIEAIDPFRNDGLMIYIEFCNPQEQMMYPQDLTLIAKGQA